MTIGIYCIRNLIDGKRYVGKSANVERRWVAHRNAPDNRHLAHAIRKYGISNFAFEVVESFDALDEQLLSDREVFWIDHFGSIGRANGYNLRRDSSSLVSFSAETKERMSEARRAAWSDDSYRAKLLETMHSDEYREKLSKANLLSSARVDVQYKRSLAGRKTWSDPSYRQAMSLDRERRWADPCFRAKMSDLRRRRWEDVEFREKMRAARTGRKASAAHRAKISASNFQRHAARRASRMLHLWVLAP